MAEMLFSMFKVKSTYKVLAQKVLKQTIAEDCIDWALEMIEAGFESEHLYILAGLSVSTNRFELDEIINKTLKELSIDNDTDEEIIQGYVYYLTSEAFESNIPAKVALNKLRKLCQDRNYDDDLLPFYLLACAQVELDELGVQFYWKDADKSNIDSIIRDKFLERKRIYETENPKRT
jgi:hypothetical protein